MLKKLLKYDLKNSYKFLIAFYLLSIFFALTTRLFFAMKQTTIINIIGQISVGCMFSMMANILINSIMRLLVRFKQTLYQDESYLTHTLPVSKNTIYNSKIILSIIILLTSFIIIIFSLFIAYYSKENMVMLKNLVQSISGLYNVNSSTFIAIVILMLFIELLTIMQVGYLGIILGHTKNNNQVLYSFVFGFIVYIASQILILLSIVIVGLIDGGVMKLITSNIVDFNSIKLLSITSTFMYIIVNIIIKLIAKKSLNKGVNVI